MNPQDAPIEVRHDEAASTFLAGTGADTARADYTLDGGRIVFTHTFVPPGLRGRGVAELLIRTGLAHAREHRLRVVPACSYVAAFIDRHSEFRDLLD